MSEKDLDIAIEKCERIMEFDTRTLKNPESENGYIFEKVYDLLEFLRQFQFDINTNTATTDTINRQVAIDYFVTNVGFHDENGYPIEDSDELRKIWTKYFDGIPSAQTELENKIRAIGYTGKEGRIYIGGRLFAIRELPQ